MNPPLKKDAGPQDERRLIELARQLDEPSDDRDVVADSVTELAEEQVDELRRAEQAIAFLERARRHLRGLDGSVDAGVND